MCKLLVLYVRCVESINRRLASVLRYGLPVMISIALFEATSRYAFNVPTEWTVEMSMFILGGMFLLGGGYTLITEGHVVMDAVSRRWSARTKAIVDMATFPLFATYLTTIILGGIPQAITDLKLDRHADSVWAPPLAPIKIIILVGVALLILQGVAILIRDVATIRGKPMP